MNQFLVNLLTPVFGPMGVSEADLVSYIDLCMNYIWVILAAIVLLVVVLIGAQFAKKGTRASIRLVAVAAWLVCACIVANMVCYGPLYNNLSVMMSGSGVELSEETIAASKSVIKEIGEEGLVLVKNTGLLPLSSDVKNLNVFGWDSTNPLFGGTGSGSSDGSTAVGILGSLKDAGYTTNADLTKIYTDYRTDRPTIAMAGQDWTLPEPTVDVYTDDVMKQATDFSDVAVVVIGRSGGEGADLPTDMYAVIHGTYNIQSDASKVLPAAASHYGYTNGVYTNNGNYDDFDQGESYLELSNTEEAMIEKVCSEFSKVIVVINANNTMELGWVDNYEQIGAVILAPGAGNTGFSALGEIINGSVNPSGRTVDTFVKDLTKTPTANNFGNFSYNNVNDLKEALAGDSAYEGNLGFVNYVEGIYVGYKFYETAADEGLINYEEYVQYPFGYGLSYTSFAQEMTNFKDNGDTVSFDVTVTNTGDKAGKEVVQVYFNPPYTNGGIEKATANLVDFAKTGTIEPGKTETVSFTINKEDMASYDSEGVKLANGGYILEAGDYEITIRRNSHDILQRETFNVAADVDYSAGRASDKTPATNQFKDYVLNNYVQLSRADGFANYAEATAAPAAELFVMADDVKARVKANTTIYYDGTSEDDPSDEVVTLGAEQTMKLADLRGKAYDDPAWETLLSQLSFGDMVTMINFGGWSTAAVESVGKVGTSDCDGPAGLSNFLTGAYGTAYPSEVLMAQTWNTKLIEKMGECMGQEYADANNFGWYGPAMNIHRNAFAGRNFEYYSEDGVLSGKLAAAEVNGAQKKGVYAEIKHFALNDQETNRCSLLLTNATEQTIREIYLKPFEMAVKNYQGTGLGVMSSFNWIGTEPSCGNEHLLKNVLRDEWGFVGFVESDYDGSYGYMTVENCVRSGNDLMLGFGNGNNPAAPNALPRPNHTVSNTLAKAMQTSCKNIMYTIVNSGYYASADSEGGMDPMTALFVKIDVAVGVAAALLLALAVVCGIRGKKKAKKA